jgi:hypothetical protein
MRSQPVQPLPDALVSKLNAVGLCLSEQRSVSQAFEGVVPRLMELPSDAVSTLAYRIMYAAQLYQHSPVKRSFWGRIIRSYKTDAEQLKSVHELEYLFVFHYNGRLRQAALEKINGALPAPFAAALILWRMNDWVPQVRQAALSCAQRTFPKTNAKILVTVVRRLLPRIGHWQRWGDTSKLVRDLLVRDDVRHLLVQHMMSGSAGSDARVFRQLLHDPAIDPYLENLAFKARNPMVRFLSAKAILTAKVSWQVGWKSVLHDRLEQNRRQEQVFEHRALEVNFDLVDLLPRLSVDPSPLVRSEVLEFVMRHKAEFPTSTQIVAKLANDPSKAVRERAEFILKRIKSGTWLS